MKTIRRMRPGLGTFVDIHISGRYSEDALLEATTMAYLEIDRVQALMSFHSKESDLSRINSARVGEWITVHPWTSRVLIKAQKLQQDSEGVFNVAIADVLIQKNILPAPFPGEETGVRGRCSAQEKYDGAWDAAFEVNGTRVRRLRPLRLDLGGIAKGFAVDRAVYVLLKKIDGSGVVNAGGDLRAFGRDESTILIKIGRNGKPARRSVTLRDGAIATSYSRSDKVISKLGKILRKPKTVSVIAADCMTADGLTKVALMGSQAVIDRCLKKYKASVVAFGDLGEVL